MSQEYIEMKTIFFFFTKTLICLKFNRMFFFPFKRNRGVMAPRSSLFTLWDLLRCQEAGGAVCHHLRYVFHWIHWYY